MGIEQGVKRAARFALPAIIAGAGFFGCGRGDGNTNGTAAVAPTTEVPPATATQEISNSPTSSPTPEATPTIQPRPSPTEIPTSTATATVTATPQPPEATATSEGPKFTTGEVLSQLFPDGGGIVLAALPNNTMGIIILTNQPCTNGPRSSIESLYFVKGTFSGSKFSGNSALGAKAEGVLVDGKTVKGTFVVPRSLVGGECAAVSGKITETVSDQGKNDVVGSVLALTKKSEGYNNLTAIMITQELEKRFGPLENK